MEAKIYNQSGKSVGDIGLPESVFNLPFNADLVHEVVIIMQANSRTPVAHVKDRSEVRGGGKKPWRQKGTGRARHGSSRSPIWTGGGVTHGPSNEKKYGGKLNKKVKAKALYSVLSEKFRNNEILFLNEFKSDTPKAKIAKEMILSLSKIKDFETLATKKNNAVYIVTSNLTKELEKSFSNFSNLKVDDVKNINPVKLLKYKFVIIMQPEDSVKFISSKLSA